MVKQEFGGFAALGVFARTFVAGRVMNQGTQKEIETTRTTRTIRTTRTTLWKLFFVCPMKPLQLMFVHQWGPPRDCMFAIVAQIKVRAD
jgi:hypothetical protein